MFNGTCELKNKLAQNLLALGLWLVFFLGQML
jgi:hypothetical protein